jgi:hypothetical protein
MGMKRPPLSEAQILAWADAFHARTGRWPSAASGPVREAPRLTWLAVNGALTKGLRGLRRGDSLARLLVRHGRRPGLWGVRGWSAAEDAWIRSLDPAEAARRTARPLAAVYTRRHRLGVSDAHKKYR